MFWRRVIISAWLLKDGAHARNCKGWTRCLCAWTRFLCVAECRLEFEVGVSYSLPCVISHATYLLQIPFFCGIQLSSALSIPSASLGTVDSKWEKGKICLFLYSFSAESHWTFPALFLYDQSSWTTEDIPSVSSGKHFNLSWKSEGY